MNKYYKNAYNNPSQYDINKLIETLETTTDEKLIKILTSQVKGKQQAEMDKQNNNYGFI